jgi:hypothetical protein
VDFVVDLDPTHLVLRVTVTGSLTDEAAKEVYRTLARLASRGGPYAAVTDLSQVVDFHVSSDTVRTLAASDPAVPGGRPKVIVAREPALYGLARMGELIRDSMGGQLQIVRSMDEAYELLGASREDFSQRLYPEDVAA